MIASVGGRAIMARVHCLLNPLNFRRRLTAGAALVLVVLCSATLHAEDRSALQIYHPWGRFHPGSWTQLRQITETLDTSGRVVSLSTTDTRTTLVQVTADGVTLKVDVTVELAGKRLANPPQTIKQGFAEQSPGQTVSLKQLGATELAIDGKKIPCQAEQLEIIGGGQRRLVSVNYSDNRPHILRKVSTSSSLPSGTTTSELTSEVIALDMPYKILNETKQVCYVKTVQKQEGTTTTVSVHAESVPGEIVSHTSKKIDAGGQLVRRSTLELVDYRVETSEPQTPPEGSRRARRHQDKGRAPRR